MLCGISLAYIGPGPGLVLQGPAFLILVGCLTALVALLTWPLRWLLRRPKKRRNPLAERVVILGLDGLEPTLVERFMKQGRLPNLKALAEEGTYQTLATTTPPLSPVAWATFSTGVNPGKHGIFDFVTRGPDYTNRLSMSKVENTTVRTLRGRAARQEPRFLRKGKSFWSILSEYGVLSHIVRVPVTWPPEKFAGLQLSAMGAPDLLGTQGTYTLFGEIKPSCLLHGRFQPLERVGESLRGHLPGPNESKLEVQLKGQSLILNGRAYPLSKTEFTPWLELPFPKAVGLAKFLLLEGGRFYMTPIQIHPLRPATPVSHPPGFAPTLARLKGHFATCGLAEDLGARDDGVLTREAFLKQCYEIHAERKRQFFHCLHRTGKGLCAVVFDGPDRVQHMTTDEDELLELYVQMDQLVGETRQKLQPNDVLFVLSDHGFKPLHTLIDLNAWLYQNGYLALCGERIDWEKTRAYTLGLAGLSLNLKGREAQGVVEPEDASRLCRELKEKLEGLRHGEEVAILKVHETEAVYTGPYRDQAPDLVLGYSQGYGVDKEAARGSVGTEVFQPNTRPWVADHCFEASEVPGVLFSNRALRKQASLADLAPTLLELFGIPAAPFHEGRSLVMETP